MNISTTAANPSQQNPIPLKFIFDKPIEDFGVEDINTPGGAISNFRAETPGFGHLAALSKVVDQFSITLSDVIWGTYESKLNKIPVSIDVNSKGEIFVLTFGNGIRKFDATGVEVSFPVGGSYFNTPMDLAINSQDEIYVADNGKRKVLVFSPGGTPLTDKTLGSGYSGGNRTEFYGPMGLEFDLDDNLYVADYYNGTDPGVTEPSRVKIYYSNGDFFEFFGRSVSNKFDSPYRLFVDSDKRLFVADLGEQNGRIQMFDVTTPKNPVYLPEGNVINGYVDSPGSITVDSYGFIYIADFGPNVNITEILNLEGGSVQEIAATFEDVSKGIQNEEFSIKVIDSSFEYRTKIISEIDLPVDLALQNCGHLLVNNATLSGNLPYNFKFDLEFYNRLPNTFTADFTFDRECEMSKISVPAGAGYNRVCQSIPSQGGEIEVQWDQTSPIASCVAPFTVTLDSNGTASITVDDIDNGSSDNCGIASKTLSKYDFTTADIGTVPVTLTITDSSGLTATCVVNVSVEAAAGPKPPEAVCNSFSVSLDADGSAVITTAQIYGGGDSSLNLDIDVSSFDCSDLGDNSVLLTVTDPATGLSNTCTAIITVVDNTAPVANCVAPFTITLDTNGRASITVDDIDSNSSDNCTIVDRTLSRYDFTSADIGVVPVTLTVTDEAELTDTCTVDVTIEAPAGPEAPEAICKDFSVFLNADGLASITAAQVYGGGDSTLNLDIDVSSFECSDIGENPVLLTVTDPATGLSDTCTATIKVVDNTAPVANCVVPFTLTLDANGQASITVVDIDNNSTDNCTIANRSLSRYNFSSADIGVIPVTLTVTDEAGLTAECTVDVTVEDFDEQESLSITCPGNQVVQLDNDCQFILPDFSTEVTTNITASLQQVPPAGTAISDETTVTITATAENGENTSCSFTILPEDNIHPSFTCPEEQTIKLGPGETFILPDYKETIAASDNCNFTVTQTPVPGTVLTESSRIEIHVIDDAENDTWCSFVLYIDSTDEFGITSCPSSQTLEASENCRVTLPDYTSEVETTEPYTNIIQLPAPGTQIEEDTEVSITVTGPAGLNDTCTFVVSVGDTTPPVIVCPDNLTVQVPAGEFFVLPDYRPLAQVEDNCSYTILQSPAPGVEITGEETSISFSVVDEAGLSDTCSFKIFLVENTPLEITCPEDQTIEVGSTCEYEIPDLTGLAGVSHADAIITQSPDGEVVDGRIKVILTATLGAETASCSFDLILDDNIPPVASCVSEFTLYLNEEGYGELSADIIDDGSTDNCGPVEKILNKTRFEVSDVGQQQVTLTVSDGSGNTDSCETTVTVVPYEVGREVSCPEDITIPLSQTGDYELVLRYTGNQENIEVVVSKSQFTCEDIGTQVVTATYLGEFTGSCDINVTVIDDLAPVVDCIQEMDLQLNTSGTASLSIEDLEWNAYDNCGITTTTLSKSTFTKADVGIQQVVLTTTDDSGNSSKCIVNVNVISNGDAQPVECVDRILIQIGTDGRAVLNPRDLFTGGSGTAQYTVSKDSFTCNELGENTVTLNYSTPSEQGSCEITVIVEDPENRCDIPTESPGDYIILYPNPGGGLVNFQTSPGLLIEHIEVFDMRGRFLFEKFYQELSIFDYKLDLERYQSGVYSLLIHTNGKDFLKRAIIRNE